MSQVLPFSAVMENVLLHLLSNGPAVASPEPLLFSTYVQAGFPIANTTNAQILSLGSKSLIPDLELHPSLN